MNYELALRLKNAGFKQSGTGTYIATKDTILTIYSPSLEELIEACLQNFHTSKDEATMAKN